MSELAVVGSNRLPIIAASINDHLAAAEQATRRGLEHAIAAGFLLIEAKELVEHGEWLTWLEANCHVRVRQAQVFMRLARNRHKLNGLKYAPSAHLTIHAAEALVGRPKPEQQHGLPGQLDLLGGPEVRPPSATTTVPATSLDRASLIADLEQVLAFIQDGEERAGVVFGRRLWREHKRIPLATGDAIRPVWKRWCSWKKNAIASFARLPALSSQRLHF
jgi:hypothetical protein